MLCYQKSLQRNFFFVADIANLNLFLVPKRGNKPARHDATFDFLDYCIYERQNDIA